jgi:hypothetical protein
MIAEATVWAPDGIGLAPAARHTPRQAMTLLLEQPEAGGLFESLYQRAGTPGRPLALCALHLEKDPRFARLAAPFVGSTERVDTYVGCMGESRSAGEILAKIRTTDLCQANEPLVLPSAVLLSSWPRVILFFPVRPWATRP